MRALIISSQSGNWEGLFVDGNLKKQGHLIDRMDLLKMSEQFGFKSSDIEFHDTDDIDEEDLMYCGIFPNKIDMLKGNY